MDARRGMLVAALAAIAITLVALVVAATVSGPARSQSRVRVEPEVNFPLPPTTGGCAGATPLPGGATSVPITVGTVSGQVAESLNVCVGGEGPFPFVLDSGAGQSTIDAGLARRLHLATAGPASQFAGVGCTGTARPVSSGSWSLDGVVLASQQLTAATLPQVGGKGEPVGLLGSDVLSRFGAVRIDFAAGALVLPGPEGAPLGGIQPLTGPTGPPPTALTHGQGTTVPLTVTPVQGDVSLNVAIRFGGGPRRDFVVDTGSSQSVVSSAIAREQSLATTNVAQRQATVCSVITVPLVRSGAWSVPGLALHRQLVGSTDFGAASLGGTQGLLGSDQLERYGWVVFDYQGGRLVLG
jgi:Aspartyl protease